MLSGNFTAFSGRRTILFGISGCGHMVGMLQAIATRLRNSDVLHFAVRVWAHVRFIHLPISVAAGIAAPKQHMGKVVWSAQLFHRFMGVLFRYFGLTPLRISSCDNATSEDPRTFTFVDTEWASYINPFALYWLFYILALESRALLQPDVSMVLMLSTVTFILHIGSLTKVIGVIKNVLTKRCMKTSSIADFCIIVETFFINQQ